MKKMLLFLLSALLLLSLACFFTSCDETTDPPSKDENQSPSTYCATFMVDGEVYEKVEFQTGVFQRIPANPSKEHYHFIGWFNGDTKFTKLSDYSSDVTLTAKFELITYTATFVANNNIVKEIPFTKEAPTFEAPAVPPKQCHNGTWEEYTVSLNSMVINAVYTIDHTGLSAVIPIAAQCNQTGTIEHWHCSGCNKNFSDSNGETEISSTTSPKVACVYVNQACKWCGTPQDSEGLAYTVNGNKATITGIGTCKDKKVNIPSKIDGYTVTAMGDKAFAELTEITAVRIPNTITAIGYRVFYGCTGLTEVTIPSSVTSIGTQIFYKANNLTTVYYNSVYSSSDNLFFADSNVKKIVFGGNKIPNYICKDCTQLTEIEILPTVTSVGSNAFTNCTLTAVNIKDIAAWCKIYFNDIPMDHAEKIYLNGEPIKEVIIPEGTKTIYAYTFVNFSDLISVTIPDSVTSISSEAFYGCTGLENVYISDISQWCHISFSTHKSNPLYYASKLYVNTELITEVNLPTDIQKIPAYAFSCDNITKITIPDSITTISEYAFADCSGITSISIPDSVTSIGEAAFKGCTKLTTMTIPFVGSTPKATKHEKHLGYIFGYNKVYDSYNYHTHHYREYDTYYTYYIPDSLKNIILLSDKVTNIGDGAFKWCSSLTSINIPDSVTSIGLSAFEGCRGLTSVIIPESVTSIGSYAFQDCSSLTSINIPDSVTSIGDGAFNGCSGLTSVHITDIAQWCIISFNSSSANPLYYANNLFLNGTLLIDLNISNGITSISDYAFNGCSSLTSINIPDSVTSIGYSAFNGCSSLTSINIPDSVTSIGSSAFGGCSSLTSINIPDSVTSIDDYTFSACSGLTNINIPNGVTSIGYYAFNGCSSLTNINIPDSVTSIGRMAFGNCTSLTQIYYNAKSCTLNASSNIFYKAGKIGNGIEVIIGDKVEKIPDYLFYNNTFYYDSNGFPEITHVTFSKNSICESIGSSAFDGCSSLTSVSIPESVTYIGGSAFNDCTALSKIYYNSKSCDDLNSSNYVFYNAGRSGSGIEVIIGNTVEKIPNYLFFPYSYDGYPKITNVIFSENSVCEIIGEHAFYKCGVVSNINLPDSLKIIGDYAFSYSRFTNVVIPDSVTSIGEGAFYYCKQLTSVTIGDGVTSIGQYAFYYCDSLTSAFFEDTTTWKVGNTILSSSKLATPSTAASYLTYYMYDYYEYTWTKT